VLALAQEEAQRLQYPYMGTEHLLLGLVREGEGVAGHVLRSLGIDLDQVRHAVETRIGRSDEVVLGEMRLTPRAKRVLELAALEARRFQHDYLGTEHLLLGVLLEGEGIDAEVLTRFGLSVQHVREQTLEILHEA
jgi:ATP-dependent Clp protease ATP-binding subunit ClpC